MNDSVPKTLTSSSQEKIVAGIEAEQRLVEGNQQLIERMGAKIAATLPRIWGEEAEPEASKAIQSAEEESVPCPV